MSTERIFIGDWYANSPYSAGPMVARRGVFLDELFQNQEAQALTIRSFQGLMLALSP
jgi:hypothetical protein